MKFNIRPLACLLGLTFTAAQAPAATSVFSGSFLRDDQVAIHSFQVMSDSAVAVRTLGYAGGTDAFGQPIAAGGFDAVVALFTAAGTLLAIADDGSSQADPVTGWMGDALMLQDLAAGSYFIALSQFGNFAAGPTFFDGFVQSGAGNYTPALTGCSAAQFCDVTGAARSGNYTLQIAVTAVPEPATTAMLTVGLLGVALLHGRRPQFRGDRRSAADAPCMRRRPGSQRSAA